MFATLATIVHCFGSLQHPIDAKQLINALLAAPGRRRLWDVATLWQGAVCAFALQPRALAMLAGPLRAALDAVDTRRERIKDGAFGDVQRLLLAHHALELLCPGHRLLHEDELDQCVLALKQGKVPTKPMQQEVAAALTHLLEDGLLHSVEGVGLQPLLPLMCIEAVVHTRHGRPAVIVCDDAWRWVEDPFKQRVPSGMAVLHQAVVGAMGFEHAVVDVLASKRAPVMEQLQQALRLNE